MDIKEWLDSSEIQFSETKWKKPPAYPYGVFEDSISVRGSDYLLCVKEHDVTIEIYADSKKSLIEAKAKIETLFYAMPVEFNTLGTNWIESERHWQTTYEISFSEKIKQEVK